MKIQLVAVVFLAGAARTASASVCTSCSAGSTSAIVVDNQSSNVTISAQNTNGPAINGIATGGAGAAGNGVSGDSVGLNGVSGGSQSNVASGVYGENQYSGFGVAGRSNSNGYAVYGDNTCNGSGCSGYAGWMSGRLHVTGAFTASGSKNFLIDHPLDPANKTLAHAAIEAPEVLNLYSGTVRLDKSGRATVRLPAYFAALNTGDFRYQLTCIGDFAPVFVAKEIADNEFVISGGSAGLKVSWQVTAVRNDRRMQLEPMIAEQMKRPSDQGKYLDPSAHGLGADKAIVSGPAGRDFSRKDGARGLRPVGSPSSGGRR